MSVFAADEKTSCIMKLKVEIQKKANHSLEEKALIATPGKVRPQSNQVEPSKLPPKLISKDLTMQMEIRSTNSILHVLS